MQVFSSIILNKNIFLKQDLIGKIYISALETYILLTFFFIYSMIIVFYIFKEEKMLVYNLVAEYAMLVIIVVILISFVRDYDKTNKTNQFFKAIYFTSLLSTLFTILSMEHSGPGEGFVHFTFVYVINILYFTFIPAVSSCYLLLAMSITTVNSDYASYKRSILYSVLPSIIYLVMLYSNIANGIVFTVTAKEGYVRGDMYLLPYFLSGINLIAIVFVILKNYKVIHADTKIVVLVNMGLCSVLLFVQMLNSDTVITGLIHTSSVLALHLYSQNKKKSVDQLTGAQNTVSLRFHMDNLIKKDEDFSLYVFSIRGFKSINERNGLEFGDEVLKIITKELLQVYKYEQVYRYGGDEFAVLLKGEENDESMIYSLLEKLQKPRTIEDIDIVTLELICARVDNKLFGSSVKELISSADYSISLLKQTHGEPYYLYDTDIVKEIINKTKMIEQIKEAIEKRKFQICYQPTYSHTNHAFTQAEALVRMIDDDNKLISPARFIDIAENTGLIVPMTFVILDIVCEDYKRLLEIHGDDIIIKSISVNFPYHIFLSPNVEENVLAILKKYDISPSLIKIEITERTFISNEKVTKEVMDRMKEHGFVFELDDFGVDYSNMSTFLNLPTQIIKIDRSVLLSALNAEVNRIFFQHLIRGISATGRIIIVEGVEEVDQLNFVLESGCEYVQGYIFAKPLLFDDFSAFIVKKNQEEVLSEFDFKIKQ